MLASRTDGTGETGWKFDLPMSRISRLSRTSSAPALPIFFSILLRDDGGRKMDRRRLGTFLAFFNVEGDVSPVI